MGSTTLIRLIVLALFFLSGCASVKNSQRKESSEPTRLGEVLAPSSDSSSNRSAPSEIVINGVKLKNTQFDYPVTINSRVEYWVDYFTGRGRPHFEKYLERSEHFIPYITPILKANGMPEDLVYLAMIESGFNNHARSFAKAVGPWQFIPATGKRYGLMVNWWVDERRDTRKSTLAAVGYLKDLYSWFGSWELASASYNAGEAKVARAIQRFGTRDFWKISRQRFLRQETRDYVPKIIAAALVAKNRTQFGFPASELHHNADEAVAGDGEVVKLLKKGEIDPRQANAREDEESPEDSTETLASILAKEGALADDTLGKGAEIQHASRPSIARPVATPMVNKKGEVTGTELAEFEVSSPADLQKIADASGLAYSTVKSLNPEVLRWVTPPALPTYRLKLPLAVKDRFLEAYNNESFQKKVQFLSYRARPGDSLQKIARHFGIRVDPLGDLNRVSEKVILRAGTRVILPLPTDTGRSLASLEVRDAPTRRKRARKGKTSHKVSQKHRQSAQGGRISLNES